MCAANEVALFIHLFIHLFVWAVRKPLCSEHEGGRMLIRLITKNNRNETCRRSASRK